MKAAAVAASLLLLLAHVSASHMGSRHKAAYRMKAKVQSQMSYAVQIRTASEDGGSPIGKVISMISDLQQKVIAEGEGAHKVYSEFSEWCEDTSKDLQYEIKIGKETVEELKATIEEEGDAIEELTAKVEDLAADVASNEAELKDATTIREKEASDFAVEEKELVETVDMIERALGILEREMAKGGASMLQMGNVENIADAFDKMVKAQALNVADASQLTALLQNTQKTTESDSDSDSEESLGAPAAKATENKSGKIIETLQSLLEKAQAQLDTLRKEETKKMNDYELLKQSLEMATANYNKDMDEAKKDIAESGEKKSVAEGELVVTSKDLAEDIKALGELHHNCMTKASDFEAEVTSRDEELKALATAKKIIKEATGGGGAAAAVQESDVTADTTGDDSAVSFVQVKRSKARLMSGPTYQAVKHIRDLAIKMNSPSLAQLASRMSNAARFSAQAGADPFAKVKGLIIDMIAKLEKTAEEEATQKAYCDKEMGETQAKKDDKEDTIEAITTKIDQMSTASAKLKKEVTILQKELAQLAKEQSEMDRIRKLEKAEYDKNQPELVKGLEGIKMALKVLTEYYAKSGKDHDADDGAASGIIGLLEVCESDFSKGLAEVEAAEASSLEAYEKETQENALIKTAKVQDVKYKTKEFMELDKSVAESSSDRDGVQEALDAVMDYFAKIKDKCIAKPESYEEAKKRREEEIAGCKEALTVIESEGVFLQMSSRRTLRGVARHSA